MRRDARRVNQRDLVIFCRQFASMGSAEVDLLRILSVLRRQAGDSYLADVLVSVENDLKLGRTLAAAFARFPTMFSPMFISMVRQGEREGILDEVMLKLADHLDRDVEIGFAGSGPLPEVRLDLDGVLVKVRPLVVQLSLALGFISLSLAALWYGSTLGLLPTDKLTPNALLLVGLLVLLFAWIFLRYTPPEVAKCSFCGAAEHQTNALVPGESHVWICQNCISRSTQAMKEHTLAVGETITGEELNEFEEMEDPEPLNIDRDDEVHILDTAENND